MKNTIIFCLILLFSTPLYAGADADVYACVNFDNSLTSPISFKSKFVPGEHHVCMFEHNLGRTKSIDVAKKGLHCAKLGNVEGDSDIFNGCAFKKSTWSLKYEIDGVKASEITVSFSHASGGDSHATLEKGKTTGNIKDIHICKEKKSCAEDNQKWNSGDTGTLYIVFNITPENIYGLPISLKPISTKLHACVYSATETIEKPDVNFTAHTESCIDTLQSSGTLTIDGVGVKCVPYDKVVKSNSKGKQDCRKNVPGVWDLGYAYDAYSGGVKVSMKTNADNVYEASLIGASPNAFLCNTPTRCYAKSQTWAVDTVGDLYVVFDPTGPSTNSASLSEKIVEANILKDEL